MTEVRPVALPDRFSLGEESGSLNYYEHHLGDYLKDTLHLSMLEEGAYRRLLDSYYGRESGIPKDQVFRIARAVSKAEKDAVKAVLKEFFRLVGDVWVKDRCEQEIARFREKQSKARASANARWHPSEGNANASEPHMPTQCSPVSSLQSPTKNKNSEDLKGLSESRKAEFQADLSRLTTMQRQRVAQTKT